jgi:hypothetical protein
MSLRFRKPPGRLLVAAGGLSLLALLGPACGDPLRRFPLADPLGNDPDRGAVAQQPRKYYSGLVADEADQILFRTLSQAARLPRLEEAVNVNSLDEVPDSSWFTNRVGVRPVSLEEARWGACKPEDVLDPRQGPWLVSAAKPDGMNPGFFIKAPNGGRYLVKFDGSAQPQRHTMAEVVGSKLYHLYGFHTPCNEIVYFRQELLRIAPNATRPNQYGQDVPITQQDVDKVLAGAFRLKDGSMRASVSRFLPGVPLGPFRYEGTRPDDPNDVVPHQDRRELRGGRLFAAWMNHYDSREQNSMDLWVEDQGRRYVRHYYLDFGDSFSSARPSIDSLARRSGHTGHFSADHVLVDLLTLGLYPRPWNQVVMSSEPEMFGYFSANHFVASKWRGAYPNPAFSRMTHRDALWAVRILARIDERLLRAAVSAGRLEQPRAVEYLVSTLLERRKRLLAEYLTQYSPLAQLQLRERDPETSEQSLCFEDEAIRNGIADPNTTVYRVRAHGGRQLDQELGWLQFRPDPAHPASACILLPFGYRRAHDLAGQQAPDDHPLRYFTIEILTNQRPAVRPRASIRLYLYDLGPARGVKLVGIDRPQSLTAVR